jgi:hypothetical protein
VCEVSQHDSEDATQTQQEQSENMNEQNENRESDQQTGVSSPQANMQMNMLADNEYRLLFEPGDPEGTLLVFRAVLERERSSDERISQVRAIFAKFDAQELQNKKDHCAIEGVYIAAKFGDVPLASFLWGYDGNPLSIPEGKHSVVGERVLDIALKHGHFDFVEFLFEHDIDKQVTNEELLHKAEERLALHNKIPSHPKQSEIFGDEPIGNRTYKAVDYSPKAEPFHPIDPVPGTLPKRFPCWCKALYSWGGEVS